MKQDKIFARNLKYVMSSPEALQNPSFLHYLEGESKKRKLNPLLFFTQNKKFMKELKKH